MAWFPVHCTSINNTNSLISGDNKGVAAQLMEKWARAGENGVANGKADFVAAFAQANVGDTSPNTQGAFCADTGTQHLHKRNIALPATDLAERAAAAALQIVHLCAAKHSLPQRGAFRPLGTGQRSNC